MTRSPASHARFARSPSRLRVAALLDPAITSNRTTKPVVSLVADSTADARWPIASTARCRNRSPLFARRTPNADATVLVGDELPPTRRARRRRHSPCFADRDGPTVTLAAVRAPAWTPADARAPIAITTHVTGARGTTVEVTLQNGDLVVDRATRAIASDDERASLTLGFRPDRDRRGGAARVGARRRRGDGERRRRRRRARQALGRAVLRSATELDVDVRCGARSSRIRASSSRAASSRRATSARTRALHRVGSTISRRCNCSTRSSLARRRR